MNALLEQKVLALCSQPKRELLRKALSSGKYKLAFISSISEVSTAIADYKPSIFIHEWQAVEESQTRKFQLSFGRTGQSNNLLRVLLVPEISPNFLAFAHDAAVDRILSYAQASLNLAVELDMVMSSLDKNELAKLQRATKVEGFRYDQKYIDEQVEEIHKKFPHDPKVKLEFGNLCFRQHKFADSLTIATEIVSREPQNVRALNLMGRSLMKQGEWDKALEVLEGANVLSPSNPERLIVIGNACYGKGDLDKAMAYYEEAVDIDPDISPAAHRQMGQIKLELGQVEEALDLFKNSVSEDEAAGFFNNAAVAAVREQKLDVALDLYQNALRALKTNRLKPLIFFNIALSHRRLGQTKLAVEALQKALRFDPDYEKARQQLDQINQIEKLKKSS